MDERAQNTIRAIETRYKGYRFRSRLEARWAVVLDHLGIEWEYEPEGYECGARLSHGFLWDTCSRIRYLPDFWLPEEGVFLEVKGNFPDKASLDRFLDCAAFLSLGSYQFGTTGEHADDRPVVLVGPKLNIPVVLTMYKGTMYASPWFKDGTDVGPLGPWDLDEIARDDDAFGNGEIRYERPWNVTAEAILRGYPDRVEDDPRHARALAAGRAARFEHGESGA